MPRCLGVSAAAALAWAAAAGGAPPDLLGTYRLSGLGRVEPHPFPPQTAELHADAVITSGESPEEVRLQLTGEGLVCELTARLDASGGLLLAQGQRCASNLRGEAFDGHFEAQLVSGSGRLSAEELNLELAFTLTGAVQLGQSGLLKSLRRFSLPGAGSDPVPVRGEGRASATGRRDRSRAAAR